MPQSLSRIYLHLVFSTKSRRPWLRHRDLRSSLYGYMASVLRSDVDSPAVLINGVEDHLHALVLLSRKFAVQDVLQTMKTETSKWIKRQPGGANNFAWQRGYGAFSVSESNVEQVKQYIADQGAHHRTMTFQEEFRELCRRHGIEIDERYVWD